MDSNFKSCFFGHIRRLKYLATRATAFTVLLLWFKTADGQSPTSPALGFSLFVRDGVEVNSNGHSHGPVAIGDDLRIKSNYEVSNQSAGNFEVSGAKIGLLVDGRVHYISGNEFKVGSNAYAKIGEQNGSVVWYRDQNNATSPLRITPASNYNGTPRINFSASATTFSPEVSASHNHVFEGGLINFNDAFDQMKTYSTQMSTLDDNANLKEGVNVLGRTNLPDNVNITLSAGANVLNITGAELNKIKTLDFVNTPSETQYLVINVDAPGVFNWSVYNSAGNVGGPVGSKYIIYNFYNTTTLNIQGGAIAGTIFAPYASIFKNNSTDIDGQVIALNFTDNGGGQIHYVIFEPNVLGTGGPVSAAFTINSDEQCLSGNSFSFSADASGGGTTYHWDFGDGETHGDANPSHIYAAAGDYDVKLIVTQGGNVDSLTKTVHVWTMPASGFTVNTDSQLLTGNSFEFEVTNPEVGNTYSWHFGDGATASTETATHSYAATGKYAVKLIVTSDKGCVDSSEMEVTVNEDPTVAAFAVNSDVQCLSGNSFEFTNNSVGVGMIYHWDLGDGVTSADQNITHSYGAAGDYTVKMYVTGAGGIDSMTQTVHVLPVPTATFTVDKSTQFLPGNSFEFAVSAPAVGNTYEWHFGDGATATTETPSHSYAAAGKYMVRLVVTNDQGCKDSTEQEMTVNAFTTVVDFTINNDEQCLAGNSFEFTNNSTGDDLVFHWEFGDGHTHGDTSPIHSYMAPGVYNVKLIVSGTGGTDSLTKTVTVWTMPAAGFTVNTGAQYLTGNNFEFEVTNPEVGNTYSWHFGDGATASTETAIHSYAATGKYAVKLIVTNDKGCVDSSEMEVTVNEDPTVAAFAVNSDVQCLSGNSFEFTNNSVGVGMIYHWDLGDGVTSADQNITHSYGAAGDYTVKMYATGAGGIDSMTQTVHVLPVPTATFTVDNSTQFLPGNSFEFAVSAPAVGNTYEWHFGDGATATTETPSHSYAAAGKYMVRLVVTNDQGCKDSTEQEMTVNAFTTVVDFTINNDEQCLAGNSFEFTNNSTGDDLVFHWEFGDGHTHGDTSPVHSYMAPGVYNVKLIVSGTGGTDSLTKTVTVWAMPAAGFTVNNAAQYLTGNSFEFEVAAPALGSTYAWSFGDGATAAGETPTHSYASIGKYNVKLIETNDNGCVDSTELEVKVNVDPTVAAFTVNKDEQCFAGNSFVFTNSSTGSGMIYHWDFGDGITTANQHPTHSYAAAGIYNVKMYATGAGGIDSTTQTVQVWDAVVVGFDVNDTVQLLAGNHFEFSTTNPVVGNTYEWQFGDGATAAGEQVSYSYAAIGNYTVKQIVTNDKGCKDSIERVVKVTVSTVAAIFTVNNDDQCLGGNSFEFTNNSTGLDPLVYHWSFGDGNTSSDEHPVHSYTAAGTYDVQLIVDGADGIDSLTVTVTVQEGPIAGFTVNQQIQELTGNSYEFTSTSVGATSYHWDFGDMTTSTDENPIKTYDSAGAYIVKLTVSSGTGCDDQHQFAVMVLSDSVSSGNQGGIESESMGGLVTMRDFNRIKNSVDSRMNYKEARQFTPSVFNVNAKKTAQGQELPDMIPAQLEDGDKVYISSPTDLLTITSAVDVLSVDYTRDNRAKAVALGIKTIDRPYSHTKSICDRFRGSELIYVEDIKIQGYDFVRFALKREGGIVEYAIAFVVGRDKSRGNYTLQTNWLLSSYESDQQMFNFQVWAAHPDHVVSLAEQVLNNLKKELPVTQVNELSLPKTYITYGYRDNEHLIVRINNTTNATSARLVFEERINEDAGVGLLEVPLTLVPGKANEFVIPIHDGYEYQGKLYLDGVLEDEVYLADGNWGIDYDDRYTTVNEFVRGNNKERVYEEGSYPVYRNVNLQASSKDYVSVYKAIRSGTEKADLTAYKSLKFYASGSGQVVVRLTRDSIIDWNSQYKTVVNLTGEGREYVISFEDFLSDKIEAPFQPSDIRTLVFTYLADNGTRENITMNISDVSFSKDAVSATRSLDTRKLSIVPNPSNGQFDCRFVSDKERSVTITISDVTGKVVYQSSANANMGWNVVPIDLGVTAGSVLFINVKGGDDVNYEVEKLIIR